MEFIKTLFRTNKVRDYAEKSFGNIEVHVWKNAFKIYYHETCIVSYSDISHDVIFDNGGWYTSSTAQNMKDFVQEIFDFKWLPRWGGIDDGWGNKYEWESGRIQIEHIKHLYL